MRRAGFGMSTDDVRAYDGVGISTVVTRLLDYERIADDVDRDRFMSPQEAVEYGLIDRVLEGALQTGNGKPADADIREKKS